MITTPNVYQSQVVLNSECFQTKGSKNWKATFLKGTVAILKRATYKNTPHTQEEPIITKEDKESISSLF